MFTLMILYCVICIILIFIMMVTELIPTYKVSITTKEIILAIVLIALAFVMLFIPTNTQKYEVVEDAIFVEHFEDADLYYDEANDMYFAVEMDRWNPFNMYHRVEISQELAISKLEALKPTD